MAELYRPHTSNKLNMIAFITVGELYYGAEKANWGDKKQKSLESTLQNFVVLPYDNEMARCYGKLVAARQRTGHDISLNDAWIAACAVRFKLPLITHNAKDFKNISDLEIITECKSA